MYNIQIIIIIITDFIIKLNASFDLLDEREELRISQVEDRRKIPKIPV